MNFGFVGIVFLSLLHRFYVRTSHNKHVPRSHQGNDNLVGGSAATLMLFFQGKCQYCKNIQNDSDPNIFDFGVDAEYPSVIKIPAEGKYIHFCLVVWLFNKTSYYLPFNHPLFI
jgi:hypothetical protein